MNLTVHHKILIVGGGTAGITVAARLARDISPTVRSQFITQPSSPS